MTTPTILVADDDHAIRTVIDRALVREGFRVRATAEAATLWRWVAAGSGDLVITDVVMPDESGLDLLPRMRSLRPDLPVVVMSARATLLTAVQAAERGAFDYLAKPFDIDNLSSVVHKALAAGLRASPVVDDGEEGASAQGSLVGRSAPMQALYRQIARLTRTNLTILLNGESGTGKELVARALHDHGTRARGPFVALNMAAIPRELIESELFGHERGSFTGATRSMAGRFREANGGTLFLDEIGDMPLEAQTRLLRVLQEGDYRAVGGRELRRANVRIIAATNRNLRRLVDEGAFREDLYYRLSVVPVHLPPLRDRASDIDDLVERFVQRAVEEGLPAKRFDRDALRALRGYAWPGNVRELENLVRRCAALQAEDTIGVETIARELDLETRPARATGQHSLAEAVEQHLGRYFALHGDALPPNGLYPRVLREMERPLITLSLAATGGNQIKAAQLLGLNRNTLRKKLRDLHIPAGRDPR